MAVLARVDSGWKTLEEMAAAAKSGTKIVWSNYGKQVQAASEIIARHYGIQVNHLRGKGGKSGVNSLIARDANVAWAGGAQRGLVAAGELVILASAEDKPLVQAPNGKTLRDYGIPYTFGFQFVLAGPKGMSTEARDAIAKAVADVITDPKSKTHKFISKQYPPGPVVVAGDALTAQLKANYKANQRLFEALSK
jgi:tripartite-type tricarboxylate transporter receptor subunit TctC